MRITKKILPTHAGLLVRIPIDIIAAMDIAEDTAVDVEFFDSIESVLEVYDSGTVPVILITPSDTE